MISENYTCDLGNINWNELRIQKDALLKLIWKDDKSVLWGLVNIIDLIQDQAVEKGIPEEEVFGKED